MKQPSRFNVAVTGLRSSGPNSQHHDVRARCCNPNPTLKRLAITLFVANHMVGREQANHRLRIFAQQQKRRQPNRGCSIATHRFGQHLFLRELWKLLYDGGSKIPVGHNPELFWRGQR
jgi:hypothetical protein